MAAIPGDWVRAAVAITPGFEVSGDPYMGISGAFDGMGISCGALQWNIGSNSLQPMIKKVGKAHVVAAMPHYGDQLWTACNTTISKGLAIVRAWQTKKTLRPKAKAELRTLMGTAEMRAEQDTRIAEVARLAFNGAAAWVTGQAGQQPSKRLFCWFFDLATQNGGLEGLTRSDVQKLIQQNKPDKADDLVCDFLDSRTGNSGHVKDAHRNGELWRDKTSDEKLEILVMSYLRSKTAKPEWRHVVLNRKGTIAMGAGWVNSGKFDFSAHGL